MKTLSQRPDPVDVASLVIVAPLAVTPTLPARRPPTARRVSTIVVAYASRPSAVHHRCSSVFSRRVAPARTTASRLRRAIALPRTTSRRPVAPLRSHRGAPPARRRRQRRSAAPHRRFVFHQ
ncbi:hypothetical protein U1Q18_001367 [Sarracenia purpurea var. burkii]